MNYMYMSYRSGKYQRARTCHSMQNRIGKNSDSRPQGSFSQSPITCLNGNTNTSISLTLRSNSLVERTGTSLTVVTLTAQT